MTVDYTYVAACIPEFMNALYNEDALASTDLKEIRDAFRKKQILGKAMLLDLVSKECNKDEKILVIGSWIGFTSFCLHKLGYYNITEIDLDKRLEPLTCWANRFNKSFMHISDDVTNIDLKEFNVIINTSCEHMDNTWFEKSSENTLLILQSTDYPANDHTNRCKSIKDMMDKYPTKLITHKTLHLDHYKRFMILGRK